MNRGALVCCAACGLTACGRCPDSHACPEPVDVLAWCAETERCALDGLRWMCTMPSQTCELWNLARGVTLSIPFAELGDRRVPSHDLSISYPGGPESDPSFPDFRAASLLFDGLSAACDRDFATIRCHELDGISEISFRYDDGEFDRIRVYMSLRDVACEAEQTVCPK